MDNDVEQILEAIKLIQTVDPIVTAAFRASQLLIADDYPARHFHAGFNSPARYSPEEAFYQAEALTELADVGWLDPEPIQPPDEWPVLTSSQLFAEYGSSVGEL